MPGNGSKIGSSLPSKSPTRKAVTGLRTPGRASWCGPRRIEHPEFEKLFRRVTHRKNFSFPALFAKDLVDSVLALGKHPP